ncbi:MAG TPA: YqgE/AlgH family protein, partial [Pedobacter sp.]
MLSRIEPSLGKLLISEPFLADPNFKRSVVLISDYQEEGTVGFVLNHL